MNTNKKNKFKKTNTLVSSNIKNVKYVNGEYNGTLKKNRKNGFGTMTYIDSSKYVGYWKYGKHDGYGEMYYNNGDYYKGEWKNNKRHGKGEYVSLNGLKFIGLFDKNCCIKGEMFYNNGIHYEGEFFVHTNLFVKHGFGIISINNTKEKYEGYWDHDSMSGKGTYYYNNSEKFEGNWYKNQKHGEGIYYFSNGDKYVGKWYNGNACGYGEYTYNNCDMIVGDYKDNIFPKLKNKIIKEIFIIEDNKYIKKYFTDYTFKNNFNENEINLENFVYNEIFNFEYPNISHLNEWQELFNNYLDWECDLINKYKYAIFFDKNINKKFIQLLIYNKIVFSFELLSDYNDNDIYEFINNNCYLQLLNESELSIEDKENIICPISLNYITIPNTLQCNHTFDKRNIDLLILGDSNENQKCPICRSDILNISENENKKEIINKCIFGYNNIPMHYNDIKNFTEMLSFYNIHNIKKINNKYSWLNNIFGLDINEIDIPN